MSIISLSYATDLLVPSQRTTVDQNFLNKRFKAIYDALTALDAVVTTYGEAEDTLVELGLARLDETLGPMLATLQSASSLGFLVGGATGAAHSLVVGEAVGWIINDGAELFTPTPFLLAQDDNDSTNWGILSLDEGGWTKSTGELATHVEYASKTQSSSQWTISANSALLPAMQSMLVDCQTAQTAVEAIHAEVEADMLTLQELIENIQEGPVASVNGQQGVVQLYWDDIYDLPSHLTSVLSAKQDVSAKLTALANLAWGANKLIYASGAGTLATQDFTNFVKTLLDDADASSFLTTLGFSTFVKTLLDDADAATARGTLGAQAALGYTPVQQGTGVDQQGNIVKIGWNGAGQINITIDLTDFGAIFTEATIPNISGGGTTNFLRADGAWAAPPAPENDAADLTGVINPGVLKGTTNSIGATTYTVQASDMGKRLRFSAATTVTVTLPNNLPADFNCMWEQRGNGRIYFTAQAGGSMQNRVGNVMSASIYSQGGLYVDANSGGSNAQWTLAGDTGA